MSGHSKWSTIKHKKGVTDAKRSKVFSRIAKAIMVAVQNGDNDPEMNSALKLAIDQAKKANMPKDNIERAMKKGSGDDSARIEEVTYEGMGPGGAMMIITCATDNTNRALTDVKTALKKNNGKFVPSGSVSFQFDFVGYISITPKDIETAELLAIEAGAEDVFEENSNLTIITSPTSLHNVLKGIEKEAESINEAKLIYNPTQQVTLNTEDTEKYDDLYEILEELDDVNEIFDNVA
ncbi:MAG: YebC/PmpR family DNA-binding transcriptional regulator [Candidatus Moraniibacteriota bacterium]|jgi:YebC/PmpR family DNA-binding regulatory protein